MVNLTKRRRARGSSGSPSDPSSPSTASNPEHGLAMLAAAASLLEVGSTGSGCTGDGSTGGGRGGGAGGGQLAVTVAASSKRVPLSGGRVPASGRVAAASPCSAQAARGIGKKPRQDPAPVPGSEPSMQQAAGGKGGSSNKRPRGMVQALLPQAAPAGPSAGAPHLIQPSPLLLGTTHCT